MQRIITLLLVFVLLSSGGYAQKKKKKNKKDEAAEAAAPKKNDSPFKPYGEIITKESQTDEGLFTVHKVKDNYYFEIPDSLMEREILVISRISGTVENLNFGGAGMKARGQQVLRFQRKDNSLLLRSVSHNSVASEESPIYQSVRNNNFEPIIATFDIKALGKDSSTYVIDVADLFTTDDRCPGRQPAKRIPGAGRGQEALPDHVLEKLSDEYRGKAHSHLQCRQPTYQWKYGYAEYRDEPKYGFTPQNADDAPPV